jgi:hypothetical protein
MKFVNQLFDFVRISKDYVMAIQQPPLAEDALLARQSPPPGGVPAQPLNPVPQGKGFSPSQLPGENIPNPWASFGFGLLQFILLLVAYPIIAHFFDVKLGIYGIGVAALLLILFYTVSMIKTSWFTVFLAALSLYLGASIVIKQYMYIYGLAVRVENILHPNFSFAERGSTTGWALNLAPLELAQRYMTDPFINPLMYVFVGALGVLLIAIIMKRRNQPKIAWPFFAVGVLAIVGLTSNSLYINQQALTVQQADIAEKSGTHKTFADPFDGLTIAYPGDYLAHEGVTSDDPSYLNLDIVKFNRPVQGAPYKGPLELATLAIIRKVVGSDPMASGVVDDGDQPLDVSSDFIYKLAIENDKLTIVTDDTDTPPKPDEVFGMANEGLVTGKGTFTYKGRDYVIRTEWLEDKSNRQEVLSILSSLHFVDPGTVTPMPTKSPTPRTTTTP